LSKKRSLILEIDNRAKEIAKDTHIPTCERENFFRINQWIVNPSRVEIKMPCNAINQWKFQFQRYANV
jgi:hypothetical protein